MAAVADVVKCWANTSLTNFKFVTYLYGYCSVQITVWDVLHLAIYLNSYLSSLISVWSFLLACASERFWTRRRLHLYSVPGGKHGLRRATCKGELDLTQYFSLFFLFHNPVFFFIWFHSNKQAATENKYFNSSPQIPGSMTAAELICEMLDRRNIPVKDREYWSCWEICNKEEMGEADYKTKGGGTNALTFFMLV